MRNSARTQIPPFFDNDPYMMSKYCYFLFHRSKNMLWVLQRIIISSSLFILGFNTGLVLYKCMFIVICFMSLR